ncbi:MAG: SPOR domain-containing protein [Thermodesulfobacteriota bacterium]
MGTSKAQSRKTAAPANRPASPMASPRGWLLLFVAGACMFVLGVMVGRNTVPLNFDMENLDRKMTRLSPSVMAEQKQPAAPDENKPDTMPFDFYDELREAPAERPDGGPPQVKTPAFDKQPEATAITVARAKKTSDKPPDKTEAEPDRKTEKPRRKTADPTPEPAEQQQAQAETEPEQTPAPQAGETKKGAYAIQVASLRDPEKAKTVRDKFRDKGYPAYTRQARVEGKGQWSRVRIGPYSAKKQAKSDLARLQNAGVDAILFLND